MVLMIPVRTILALSVAHYPVRIAMVYRVNKHKLFRFLWNRGGHKRVVSLSHSFKFSIIHAWTPIHRSGFAGMSIYFLLLAVVLLPVSSVRAEPPPAMALQGFSGILNTPTADVQEEGSLNALYSDQRDRFKKGTPPWQDNYLFSVGFFNCIEIGGRLTEAPGIARDLSGNAKFSSAPFSAHLPYAPAVALGIQDLGGGSTTLRSSYLAVSGSPLTWMRLSAGYGLGPDRMKGAFGGVELRAHEWVTLLGEYDTRNVNAGLRLTSPPLPYFPARLTVTVSTSLNHSNGLAVAAGFSLPLNMKKTLPGASEPRTVSAELKPDLPTKAAVPGASLPAAATEPATHDSPPATENTPPGSDDTSTLTALRDRLVRAGFVNVRVGDLGGTTLVVEYENIRYNHNELDALGVVAGMASQAAPEGIEQVRLVVKHKGLRLLRVSAPLRELRGWLADAGSTPPVVQVDQDPGSRTGIRFVTGDENPGWLRPSLMVFPGLTTFVGTEVGVFNYLLSIKPALGIPLWNGALLGARWDIPVAWSGTFEKGKAYASVRKDARMDRLMFYQGINLRPGLLANLGAGMILHDTYGTLNELDWSPGSGTHRFKLIQAWARDNEAGLTRTVWLASYRLYIASLDLFMEGTGGRFWNQDTGGLLELKRFFGDSAVSLYYKNTVTATDDKRWQAAGIQFSFPLTPRRDMRAAPVQIRGADEWGYAQETVLAINGQKTNDTISGGLGVRPIPEGALYHSYLNRDRLSDDYIQAHLDRIREAWQTYRSDL